MRPLLATATLAVEYVRMRAVLPSKIWERQRRLLYKSFNRDYSHLSTRPQTEVTELQVTIAGVVSARRTW